MWRWIILFLLLPIVTYCDIRPAQATVATPSGDLLGSVSSYIVQEDDNLYDIARRFDLGIVELLAANKNIDPWTPKVGAGLTLTTQHILPPIRRGIVVNLSELRLFYFMPDGRVMTFPIGIGREGWQTPLGETMVIQKRRNPGWIPPVSIRAEDPDLPDIVPPGPDNPLGAYALSLNFFGILIHGTNRPAGVGKRSSHGCIRLYPEDIKTLFDAVSIGTPVSIIDMPYKLGWRGNALYLEVMPNQNQADSIAAYQRPMHQDKTEAEANVERMANGAVIDNDAVRQAILRHDGIPVPVGQRP